MRLPTLLIFPCLAFTACSAIPVDHEIAAGQITDVEPGATTIPDSSGTEDQLADVDDQSPGSLAFDDPSSGGADDAALADATEAGRRYRWTVRATVERESGVVDFSPLVHGWFDAATGNAVTIESAAQAATLDPPAPGEVATAWVDGVKMSRGHEFDADLEPRDPAAWYASDLDDQGESRLFATIEGADVWRILGRTPTDEPFVVEPGEFASRLKSMGAVGFGNLVEDEVSGDSSALELTVTTVDAIVTRIVVGWDAPTANDLMLDVVMKPISGLKFPDPRQELAGPPEPAAAQPTPLQLPESATGPAFGSVLQIDGTQLAQPFRAALTIDNQLVIMTNTSASAAPADFVTWQLDAEGADLVRFVVLENDVLKAAPSSLLHHSNLAIDAEGRRRLTASTETGTADAATSATLDLMVDRLLDPSWLGGSIIAGPVPWVPETLTLELVDDGSQVEVLDWPLAPNIADLSRILVAPDGTSHSVICLGAGQVEPIWSLLGDGRGDSSLTFADGQQTHQARVILNSPGFRSASDPCVK